MDDYSGKRAGGGFGIGGRGTGLAFRDASSHNDRNVHCNRLVCSNRLNLMKSPQGSKSEKDKSSSAFRTNGKSIAVGSSKAYSVGTNFRKVSLGTHDPSSLKGTVSSGTNTMQLENVNIKPSSSTTRVQMKLPAAKDTESGVFDGSVNTFEEVESYCVTSSSRPQKQLHRHPGEGNQEASVASSSRHYFGSRNNGQATKATCHGQGFSASRSLSSIPQTNKYGFKNLGCSSISDILPPGCSSSDISYNGREEVVRRSRPDGEYSSAKGKSIGASASAGNLGSRKNFLSGRSLSLSERPSQPISRKSRYCLPSKNGVASVRTRRPTNEDNRPMISERDNATSRFEPSVVIPQMLQNDASVSESNLTLSQQSSADFPTTSQSSCVQLGGRNENVLGSPITRPQDGRQFSGLSIDRDGYPRCNRDGIAEVLLALERIEQDEELTYEQLLILETNLFLSGLAFHDQHRDMRLDIDNMSYEELLALGDKMGTVSTGLTEEQLSSCLKRSFYMPAPAKLRIGSAGDDVKCSVCQEEYAEGDEMGTLRCEHHYHLVCIHQWLRLKKWCPICKAQTAADSN